MRPEEDYAARCLRAAIPRLSDVSPGEDPPDFYVVEGGVRIAVEVTRITPASFDEDGNMKNRTTEDSFSENFSDQLDTEFRETIPGRYSIVLHIKGPIRNPRKFKNGVRALVADAIAGKGVQVGWKQRALIARNEIELTAVPPFRQSGRRIVSIVENEDASIWVVGEVKCILEDRIATKNKIMSEIDWTGPRWLTLIDDHPMAGFDEYEEAYQRMNLTHLFNQVLIVGRDGSVRSLWKAG